MVFIEKPFDFDPQAIEVGSCIIQHKNTLLMLLRRERSGKKEGNKWGVPAGRIERERPENELEGTLREVWEETGIKINSEQIVLFGTVFVRYGGTLDEPETYDFIYHMYGVELLDKPEVSIDESEHSAHQWVDLTNVLALPLVRDQDTCLRLYFRDRLS